MPDESAAVQMDAQNGMDRHRRAMGIYGFCHVKTQPRQPNGGKNEHICILKTANVSKTG